MAMTVVLTVADRSAHTATTTASLRPRIANSYQDRSICTWSPERRNGCKAHKVEPAVLALEKQSWSI